MKKFLLSLLMTSSYLFGTITLDNILYPSEEFSMLLALFGLAIIAMLALFLSSRRISNFKKEIESINRSKEDLLKQHNEIISNMGENIQSIAAKNIGTAQKLSTTNDILSMNEDIHLIKNSENKLLSIATNLIEFLRLKSKKIKISNEKFSFSNLFNDVSGTLKDILKDIPLELHYMLSKNVKENIYSDTLNLSKILVNVLLEW